MEWFVKKLEERDFGKYCFWNANCQDFATHAFNIIRDADAEL